MADLQILAGNTLDCRCRFLNAAGAPTAPTTVVCRVLPPSGPELTPTVSPDIHAASYQAQPVIPANAPPGLWYWRWEGSGALVASAEDSFTVVASHFPAAP